MIQMPRDVSLQARFSWALLRLKVYQSAGCCRPAHQRGYWCGQRPVQCLSYDMANQSGRWATVLAAIDAREAPTPPKMAGTRRRDTPGNADERNESPGWHLMHVRAELGSRESAMRQLILADTADSEQSGRAGRLGMAGPVDDEDAVVKRSAMLKRAGGRERLQHFEKVRKYDTVESFPTRNLVKASMYVPPHPCNGSPQRAGPPATPG